MMSLAFLDQFAILYAESLARRRAENLRKPKKKNCGGAGSTTKTTWDRRVKKVNEKYRNKTKIIPAHTHLQRVFFDLGIKY